MRKTCCLHPSSAFHKRGDDVAFGKLIESVENLSKDIPAPMANQWKEDLLVATSAAQKIPAAKSTVKPTLNVSDLDDWR